MSNIENRLRAWGDTGNIFGLDSIGKDCVAGADEIESLRAEIDSLKQQVEQDELGLYGLTGEYHHDVNAAYDKGKRDAVPEGYTRVPTEILERFPEINPSNYDHDDACALNAWGVELVLAAAPKEK